MLRIFAASTFVALAVPSAFAQLTPARGAGALCDLEFEIQSPTGLGPRGNDPWGSGHFGAPRDGGKRRHAGDDSRATVGAPVRAPVAGRVRRIEESYEDRKGLLFVEIDAGCGRVVQVHYVKPSVRVGDLVVAGDEIGFAQSLQSRYPGILDHLHIVVLINGKRVDPRLFMKSNNL
jgi:peptidoglycan LD-endopeptidase LytH